MYPKIFDAVPLHNIGDRILSGLRRRSGSGDGLTGSPETLFLGETGFLNSNRGRSLLECLMSVKIDVGDPLLDSDD